MGRAPGLSPRSDAGDRDGHACVPLCVPSPHPHRGARPLGCLVSRAFMKKYHIVTFLHIQVLLEVPLNLVKSL